MLCALARPALSLHLPASLIRRLAGDPVPLALLVLLSAIAGRPNAVGKRDGGDIVTDAGSGAADGGDLVAWA